MAYEEKTFNGTGADCSGSSGESSRVLTLTNTAITKQSGFLIYASGLPLCLDVEYTISHKSAGTEITFLNGLWDDMTLIVNYYEKEASDTETYSKARSDVQSIISEHGISAILKRPTDIKDSMGGVSEVSYEEYNIFVSIQDITNKDREIINMGLANPGNAKAFFYHEYPDSITNNGTLIVQTGDIIVDNKDVEWKLEKITGKKVIQGEIIFISTVINKIDLD